MSLPSSIAELRSLKQRFREIGPRPPWWRPAKRRAWVKQCHEWLADSLALQSAAAHLMAVDAVQSGLVAVPRRRRR